MTTWVHDLRFIRHTRRSSRIQWTTESEGAQSARSLGKTWTTSTRRLISRLIRSNGFDAGLRAGRQLVAVGQSLLSRQGQVPDLAIAVLPVRLCEHLGHLPHHSYPHAPQHPQRIARTLAAGVDFFPLADVSRHCWQIQFTGCVRWEPAPTCPTWIEMAGCRSIEVHREAVGKRINRAATSSAAWSDASGRRSSPLFMHGRAD